MVSAAQHNWLDHRERSDAGRWLVSAVVVLTIYAGAALAYGTWEWPTPARPAEAPAIMVELSPLTEAPSSDNDLPPGPEMVESQLPPEAPPPVVQDLFEPLPELTRQAEVLVQLQDKPAERKPPERDKVETPQPLQKPPEPVRVQKKPPAPRTSAAPRSRQPQAAVARAPSPGSAASPAAVAAWRDQVVSRLQRAKRYPASSESRGEQGVVTLSFTVNRNGGVTSRGISRSSGHPALDQEVLAMVSRASPFPAFPEGMPQASVSLSVPIRFALR